MQALLLTTGTFVQKNSEKRFHRSNDLQYIQQCRRTQKKIYQGKFHRRNQQQCLTIYSTIAGLFKKWRLSKKLLKQWIEYQGNFPLPLEQNNILHNIYCILQLTILPPTGNITIFTISYDTIYNIYKMLQYNIQYSPAAVEEILTDQTFKK